MGFSNKQHMKWMKSWLISWRRNIGFCWETTYISLIVLSVIHQLISYRLIIYSFNVCLLIKYLHRWRSSLLWLQLITIDQFQFENKSWKESFAKSLLYPQLFTRLWELVLIENCVAMFTSLHPSNPFYPSLPS